MRHEFFMIMVQKQDKIQDMTTEVLWHEVMCLSPCLTKSNGLSQRGKK
jgi:hypothetical protein